MQHLCFGSVERCLHIITHLSPSIIASCQGQQPVTHLAHTSSGSIHSVTSGRRSSLGVSSLSSHAFWTSPQTAPLFIRMHLCNERLKKKDISISPRVRRCFCDAFEMSAYSKTVPVCLASARAFRVPVTVVFVQQNLLELLAKSVCFGFIEFAMRHSEALEEVDSCVHLSFHGVCGKR